ncbi:MAG: sialidase [Candidatus Brocadiia bacterium]|nr:MAG: sialidase [Candidatus Brocadiia bacterium]
MTFFMGGKYPANNGYENQPGLLGMEFIYETASFPQCHASTIVETRDGLVSAWFGGTHEKNPDVGIWLSRLTAQGWTAPVEVANGVESPQKRYPCWNPVLFQPWEGPLILFYKVGPGPGKWWVVMKTSDDCGRTWSEAKLLPEGFAGPIKNKPIELQDETILCPTSTEDNGWRVHFEKYWYKTGKWEKTGPINDGKEFGAIQPSIMTYFKDNPRSDKLQVLCRSKQGVVTEAWSSDRGKTWGKMTATSLPNPNSGTDAVTLTNGMQLIVYNHTARGTTPGGRAFLNVAVSKDGKNWEAAMVLEKTEKSEFSYPAVIQTADDLVHITYSWKRQSVKHVVIDPAKLVTRPIVEGKWPE